MEQPSKEPDIYTSPELVRQHLEMLDELIELSKETARIAVEFIQRFTPSAQ